MCPTLPESNSFADLGGIKVDYSAVVDSSTDRSAQQINDALCNVAEMTRVSLRGWIRFILGASGTLPQLVSPTSWDTTWRGGTGTSPVFTHLSIGVYLITFPATVNDEAGVSHPVNIRFSTGGLEPGQGAAVVQTYNATPNVITVNVYNLSGSLADFTGAVCTVTFG